MSRRRFSFPFLPVLFALFSGYCLSGCNWEREAAHTVFVDAAKGSDRKAGTSAAPFKTITHAIGAVGADGTIRVRPGTYDEALGETFPLVLQPGQVLVGDEANRGNGATPTVISGAGPADPPFELATVVGSEGSRISGFTIGDSERIVPHMAVVVDNATVTISNNTFSSPTYGGVHLDNGGISVIDNNVFATSSCGVYVANCPDGPTIRANTFTSPSFPIDIDGTDSYAVVTGNTITGDGAVGIRVLNGHPLIEDNLFNKAGGYTYGAINVYSPLSRPTVRENEFACAKAVLITQGDCNLGTAGDSGNNDFTSVTGVSVTHEGTATVYAVGNTWPHATPAYPDDIAVTGTGAVYWGSGPDDYYPFP